MLYNLSMTVREKIEQEKLQNIINPRKANTDFKITIRFQKHLSRDYEEALEIARKNKYFMEEGEGEFYKVYVSFYPEDVDQLHAIYERIKDQPTTRIYLNNKIIPYTQDLWLFLFWFYRIKPEPADHP